MKRRSVLFLLSLAGCTRVVVDPIPESAAGWRKQGSAELSAADIPEPLRKLGATSARSFVFRREQASIDVRLFAFPSDASAFEARQKFTPPSGVAFHHGPFLVLCASNEPSRTVIEFASALESAWQANAR